MIENKELDILDVGTMDVPKLKEVAKKLKLGNIGKKSGVMLRKEVNNLTKVFIAGQVNMIYIV